eukprot:384995_1
MSKPYLKLYNILSSLGWLFILITVIQSAIAGNTGKELWASVSTLLIIVQSAAALEIFHSMFGLVRSPILPTFMQVMSRLLLVWMYMVPTSGANGHWALYLCIGSWSLVEIPRYLFYFIALDYSGQPHKINSTLFFLRYNLFMILYPSGITGELFIMYNAYGISDVSFFMRIVAFHLLLYIPLAPFMIMNMWGNKKRSDKKRQRSANPRPLNGLIWPITDAKKNARSTTKTNKSIWAASMATVDKNMSTKCEKERNWRFGYNKHVMNNVVLSCKSEKNALEIANAGLNKAYELFEFKRNNKIIPFAEAMRKGVLSDMPYDTHIIKGNGSERKTELEVPYGGGKYQGKEYYLGLKDQTILKGLVLRQQLDKWVKYGTIEPSAAEEMLEVNNNKDKWLDLSDKYFVLLGATSAMGPLYFLLSHGANIIAVDLNRDFIWKKLFKAVRASCGTLIFPVTKGTDISKLNDNELAKVSGSDLLASTPEIANWLETVMPNTKLTIGNYTYLDGALHVQLSLACDSIIQRVCAERKDTTIAFLCTPTDNHVITKEAYLASKEALKSRVPTWASAANSIFCGQFLGQPNYKCMKMVKQNTGDDIYIIDGIAVAQGPNYALAKRMQHWRAVIAYNNGHVVSSNVAPSTATESVVHNAQFAAAYGGMHHFAPMEVMYQRTSLAVMGALLIHDVCNKDGASNPQSKIGKSLRNPFELFSYGSFHGGVQRCSYKIDKIGVPSAVSFYLKTYKLAVIIGTTGFGVLGNWLITGNLIPFL